MKQVLLQIGKHSSIYMISQIVSNSISVLMLPIYLQYFTPEEFGGMALIDLSMALFRAGFANGTLSATSRFHFEEETVEGQRTVWWTGFALVMGTMTVCSAVLLVTAGPMAWQLLGPENDRGTLWLRLAAVSVWLDLQNVVVWTYLRTHKRSATIMQQTILRTLVFVAIAVPSIMIWNLGPTAMFVANIAASGVILMVQAVIMAREWGRPRFSVPLFWGLWRYAWPMLVVGVLLIVMQSLSRWFVGKWISVGEAGLLSLGIQVAEKVHRLIVTPFQQIWNMLVFELHKEHPEQAVRTFCFIFEMFCYLLISVFFGCSITAAPVLQIIAQADYLTSVPLIPVLCLAQFFFAIHDHFLAPLRLSKQTYLILPASVTGILTACLMNAWLIPAFGATGAAWATVATYAAYSFVNLLIARQVEKYPYPFLRIGTILAGVCGTFYCYVALESMLQSQWLSLGIGLTLWLIWTLIMAAVSYRHFHEATIAETATNLPVPALADPVTE